jgi:exosortase/archaeosortase family protein
VVRSGTAIISAPVPQLGIRAGEQFAVDIADPCSGIRSLFALMMVSALYAYYMVRTETGFRIQDSGFGKKGARFPLPLSILQACVKHWRRWLLFACSVPLAVLGNLVRILALTFGTILFGSEFAIGKNALTEPSFFHMAAGYLVFAVALGGMAGIGWLLNQENGQWKLWAAQLRAWFAALKKGETPDPDGKAKPKNSRPASEY